MLFLKELHLHYQNKQANILINPSFPIALKNKKEMIDHIRADSSVFLIESEHQGHGTRSTFITEGQSRGEKKKL